jgi:hypothetical protein
MKNTFARYKELCFKERNREENIEFLKAKFELELVPPASKELYFAFQDCEARRKGESAVDFLLVAYCVRSPIARFHCRHLNSLVQSLTVATCIPGCFLAALFSFKKDRAELERKPHDLFCVFERTAATGL